MELYQTPPNEDQWALIPEEIACEIITRITDLRSLLNYMESSRTFYNLAQICIREIHSSTSVQVPISFFTGFKNLRVIGEKILVKLPYPQISLLSTLPQLRAANFNLLASDQDLGRFSIEILDRLGIAQKLPGVNFKIWHRLWNRLLIQGDRVMFIRGGNPAVSTQIEDRYPQLRYVDWDRNLNILNYNVANFLREGDFGLVDPGRPPSETNVPLSFQRVVDSGLASYPLIFGAMIIYAQYHNLGGIIINPQLGVALDIPMDDLMRRHFSSVIKLVNQRILFRGGQAFPLDRISNQVISHTYLSPNYIDEGDIPVPLSADEYDLISRQLHNTVDYYLQPGRVLFYRSDGSIGEVLNS